LGRARPARSLRSLTEMNALDQHGSSVRGNRLRSGWRANATKASIASGSTKASRAAACSTGKPDSDASTGLKLFRTMCVVPQPLARSYRHVPRESWLRSSVEIRSWSRRRIQRPSQGPRRVGAPRCGSTHQRQMTTRLSAISSIPQRRNRLRGTDPYPPRFSVESERP